MFRIALLLSLVSTSAIACDNSSDWNCTMQKWTAENEASERAERYHNDEMVMRQREYDQRERLSFDEDRRQQLIQGQLNQLNMNTVPRY